MNERAHENEQRQYRELEVRRQVDDLLSAHRQSALQVARNREAADADQDHPEPER